MSNDKRVNTVSIRLTDEEKEYLVRKGKEEFRKLAQEIQMRIVRSIEQEQCNKIKT